MNLVLLHDALYLGNFRVGRHSLGFPCHDVADGAVEELSLPALHGTTYIAVGDDAYDTTFCLGYAQSQFTFAHQYDSFAQMHLGGKYRQIVAAHHVVSRRQQSLAQLSARVQVCEVLRTELSFLHQGDGQRVAHHQSGCSRTGGSQVQRAGLFLNPYIQVAVAVFGQQ